MITFLNYAYSGNHIFGNYAMCLEYLLELYKVYSSIFSKHEELFIKVLYRLTNISGSYGDLGYDYKGISAIVMVLKSYQKNM
ncbi:hypothetical protein [Clostridium sp. Marseille-Q7071]